MAAGRLACKICPRSSIHRSSPRHSLTSFPASIRISVPPHQGYFATWAQTDHSVEKMSTSLHENQASNYGKQVPFSPRRYHERYDLLESLRSPRSGPALWQGCGVSGRLHTTLRAIFPGTEAGLPSRVDKVRGWLWW